jgi:hypothetical protein
MSKQTPTKSKSAKPASPKVAAPNDSARAEALAKLAATPVKDAKGARGPTAGKKDGPPAHKGTEATSKAKATKLAKTKRLSALDAAAKILADADRPLRVKDLIENMHAKGLWTSPGGKTPAATLYAAIIREITAKGKDARFKKVERGMFASPTAAKAGKGG